MQPRAEQGNSAQAKGFGDMNNEDTASLLE
jgi:hypothetical protein